MASASLEVPILGLCQATTAHSMHTKNAAAYILPSPPQEAHLSMLRKDMGLLDLELLALKVKLKMGDSYKGSPVQVIVAVMQCAVTV